MKIKRYLDKPILSKKFKWQEKHLDKLIYFPWLDVLESRYLGKYKPMKKQTTCCDKCNKKENVIWVYFVSPDITWREMCGRAGYLSICVKCKKQIQFQMSVMN